jgi:nucleotide-binding universal stress UspA family protein
MFSVRRILYATDFSSYSNQAYFHAVALAEHYQASLDVTTVWTADAACGDQDECQSQLETIRPSNPKIDVKHVFLQGDPAAEIVRYATQSKAGLIVMGTHGRTGIDRLLMGSVAERVMREAPCSVLVIKLPKAPPQPDRPVVEMAGAH